MNEIIESPLRGRVVRLQAELLKLPQMELPTYHFFADGMYGRMLPRVKGILIVGKIHKREHFYIVMNGCVRVTTDEGVRDVRGPAVLVSSPGTKRAVLALEDSVCMTVHRTDKTDLDEIEEELIEPEPMSAFDSGNKLKEIV